MQHVLVRRNAYNMVLHKYGERLYNGLVVALTKHCKEVASMVEGKEVSP